jgi:hypothetical protein
LEIKSSKCTFKLIVNALPLFQLAGLQGDIHRRERLAILVDLAGHEYVEEAFFGSEVEALQADCEHEGGVALVGVEGSAQARAQFGSVDDFLPVEGLLAEIEEDCDEKDDDEHREDGAGVGLVSALAPVLEELPIGEEVHLQEHLIALLKKGLLFT